MRSIGDQAPRAGAAAVPRYRDHGGRHASGRDDMPVPAEMLDMPVAEQDDGAGRLASTRRQRAGRRVRCQCGRHWRTGGGIRVPDRSAPGASRADWRAKRPVSRSDLSQDRSRHPDRRDVTAPLCSRPFSNNPLGSTSATVALADGGAWLAGVGIEPGEVDRQHRCRQVVDNADHRRWCRSSPWPLKPSRPSTMSYRAPPLRR